MRDTTTRYCFHFIVMDFLAAYCAAMVVWPASYLRLTATVPAAASPESPALLLNHSGTELNGLSP